MVANNMLLAVHCKKTDQVDIKAPILKFITATYGDRQANDAADDLANVQQLRNDVSGLTGALPALRDTLAKRVRPQPCWNCWGAHSAVPVCVHAAEGFACVRRAPARRAPAGLRCLARSRERTLLCTLPWGRSRISWAPAWRAPALLRAWVPGRIVTGGLACPDQCSRRALAGRSPLAPSTAWPRLRRDPAAAPRGAPWARRYYRALSLMETRFPVGDDAEHVRLRFTWYDSFRPSKKTEQASIHYEKASVLFNVGAVLTQMALAADRGSDAGLKEAARRFQARRGARPDHAPGPAAGRACLESRRLPGGCLPRAARNEEARRQRAPRRGGGRRRRACSGSCATTRACAWRRRGRWTSGRSARACWSACAWRRRRR
jgi:hypothetical protein